MITLRALMRKVFEVILAVIPFACGLKLLVLLLKAKVLGAYLILPFWPNVADAILLLIAGGYFLARVGAEVWQRWWARGRRGEAA